MPEIRLENVTNYICDSINLVFKNEEITTITGPNGAGKSTILNIIAGLTEHNGTVYFDNKNMVNIPPYKRKIGYVFQNPALFPHLNVYSNIAYGMSITNKNKITIETKVDELMKLTGIAHLREKYPKTLSGGEKQRTALARALALSPDILLLDEPFNSLDLVISHQLRQEFQNIIKHFKLTAIFVTHNLEEAKTISHKIININQGRVDKNSDFVKAIETSINDNINILNCNNTVIEDNGLIRIECDNLVIHSIYENKNFNRVAIASDDIKILGEISPGKFLNQFEAKIVNIIDSTSSSLIEFSINGKQMFGKSKTEELKKLNLKVNDETNILLNSSGFIFYSE